MGELNSERLLNYIVRFCVSALCKILHIQSDKSLINTWLRLEPGILCSKTLPSSYWEVDGDCFGFRLDIEK